MKLNCIFLVLFGVLVSGTLQISAQSLVILHKDGSSGPENLSAIQKITFSDDNLFEELKTGAVNTFTLSSIQKIYFDTSTGLDKNEFQNTTTFMVYPNPANEIINVNNLPAKAEHIFIFKSNGQLVLSVPVLSGSTQINISKLNKGLYFLMVNGQSTKFIKQ